MPTLKPNGKRLNGKGSGWISRSLRNACYLRDRFTCYACQRDLHNAEPREVTLDHVEPKVNGANHHPNNLLTCCLRCNSRRQHMPFREWVESAMVARLSPEQAEQVQQDGAAWRKQVGKEVHRLKMQARRRLPLTLARSMSVRSSSQVAGPT